MSDTKTCTRCLNNKPLDQFRRRGRNDDRPAAHCHECHRLAVQMWRDRQRLRKAKGFAHEIDKAGNDLKVILATTAAVRAFGGTLGLARAFNETYFAAMPGSPTRDRLMTALMRMTEVAGPLARPDKNLLSDEDIDREMERLAKKIERDKAQGWTGLEYVI
ncbi:MAG: hypothetical protein IAF94_09340 [Pirellulaceae bacterium]|nr:hypothetical protein [Pirellulaceae bacterium]